MSEQKNISTNGEPVTTQAPVPSTDSTTQTTQAPQIANPGKPAEEATASSTQTNSTEALALDYLSGGYYKGEGKQSYPNPDLVSETAQRLARDLAEGKLTPGGFNPILRDLKKANKKTLPLEAKRGALAGAIVMAKQLQQRKRASGLLADILERNRAAVQTDADYKAAVKHLTAVGVFLGDYQK